MGRQRNKQTCDCSSTHPTANYVYTYPTNHPPHSAHSIYFLASGRLTPLDILVDGMLGACAIICTICRLSNRSLWLWLSVCLLLVYVCFDVATCSIYVYVQVGCRGSWTSQPFGIECALHKIHIQADSPIDWCVSVCVWLCVCAVLARCARAQLSFG